MDKIGKILQKVSKNDAVSIIGALEKIKQGKLQNLDVKKLKGYDDVFRVRVGNFRIIFQIIGGGHYIIEIAKRREDTYRKF